MCLKQWRFELLSFFGYPSSNKGKFRIFFKLDVLEAVHTTHLNMNSELTVNQRALSNGY
jgi:hypothetical protein